MAFDGLTTACLVREFSRVLTDARIAKIAQPEADELLLSCKTVSDEGWGRQVKLTLSAEAQLPMARLTKESKASPLQAPSFCMLLRKHLENGRILSVEQPSLERVIRFAVSHYDEMGDLRTRTLVIELMGKHSNIILIDENDVILDAIKHIPSSVSSVREVLPGRTYFLPDTRQKQDPFAITDGPALAAALSAPGKRADSGAGHPARNPMKSAAEEERAHQIHGALIAHVTGISPLMATEICFRAKADPATHLSALGNARYEDLAQVLKELMTEVREGRFSPRICYEGRKAVEYAVLPLLSYEDKEHVSYDSVSELLRAYYEQKSVQSRMRNKSADLRQQVQTVLARTVRKYDLQMQQMKDTEKRDKYRLRGELLTAYAHEVPAGAKEVLLTDYNTGKEVKIPLEENLSATENAQKCFERYQRMKRTYENLSQLTKEVAEEIEHLKSIRMALDLATEETELAEIRRELVAAGYLRGKPEERAGSGKKNAKGGASAKLKGSAKPEKSAPLHYVTSDGYDVYVGKNNDQNDLLTFGERGKDDWWFHAKQMPGSHVVLRGKGEEIPDRAFEEAAALAAYYSTGRDAGKVEVDYTELKNVKKPAKAKPGFVIYYTNYSLVADTDISGLTQLL
ncbi:MAG: NFACT family protein [Lachnospiraceae bacterium]|nr:NFACT family protein [Lachnospiraceae bacterium]